MWVPRTCVFCISKGKICPHQGSHGQNKLLTNFNSIKYWYSAKFKEIESKNLIFLIFTNDDVSYSLCGHDSKSDGDMFGQLMRSIKAIEQTDFICLGFGFHLVFGFGLHLILGFGFILVWLDLNIRLLRIHSGDGFGINCEIGLNFILILHNKDNIQMKMIAEKQWGNRTKWHFYIWTYWQSVWF